MDWRSFGVGYTIEDVGTFWLHPGTPFRAELIRSELESWGVDPKTAAAWGWLIIEGYIVDADDLNPDHHITLYWDNRGECKNLQARWELYQSIFETDDFLLIYDAFENTRPTELQVENGADPDEKKSDTSKPPVSTQKTKASVTKN